MKNQVMLITYGDSLGKNFKELEMILDKYYEGAIGSVHILPFFPSSADRGFAPMCYDKVDQKFGDFSDLTRMGEKYDLMYDFMVNHISAHSPYYLDFKEKKEESEYKSLFIRYKDFWEGGEPTQEQIDKIYKRKPKAPYVSLTFGDGTTEKIWCTFGEEQIDLNVANPQTKEFIKKTIRFLCEHGAKVIRLDAFAYAVKKADTSCFFDSGEKGRFLADVHKEYGINALSMFPSGLMGGCTMTKRNAYVVGPEGELYKCWNDVGVPELEIGNISSLLNWNMPLVAEGMVGASFLEDPKCEKCFFFPICDGGCPRMRLLNNRDGGKRDTCSYFKNHLKTLLEMHYEEKYGTK